MEATDEEIMDVWLSVNPPDTDGIVKIRKKGQEVPLSFDSLVNWLSNHKDIRISFPVFNHIYLIVSMNDNENLNIDISLPNPNNVIQTQRIGGILNLIVQPEDLDNTITAIVWSNHSKTNIKVRRELNRWLKPSERKKYHLGGRRLQAKFEKSLKVWRNPKELLGSLPGPNIKTIVTTGVFDNKDTQKSGGRFHTKLILNYGILSHEDQIKLIINKNNILNEIKKILTNNSDFGYYIINILSVQIRDIAIRYDDTRVKIFIITEVITAEDYYKTIGYYKTLQENICVKGDYTRQGLQEIARELLINKINKYNDDELCEVISQKIDNLRWDDFKEDEDAEDSTKMIVKYKHRIRLDNIVDELDRTEINGHAIRVRNEGAYKLIIKDVAPSITMSDIEEVFSKYGDIEYIKRD